MRSRKAAPEVLVLVVASFRTLMRDLGFSNLGHRTGA